MINQLQLDETFKNIHKLFETSTICNIKCLSCGNIHSNVDCQLNIYMNTFHDWNFLDQIQKELVSDYYCNKCSKYVNCHIYRKIQSLSSIVVLIIKQKYINPSSSSSSHWSSFVWHSSTDSNTQNYILTSQIHHSGSYRSGHYYSTCKRSNEFYLFNDSHFSKISNNKILPNTTILMYSRSQII